MHRLPLPHRSAPALALAGAIVWALAGCGSTPPVRFHTLMPAETPRAATAPSAAAVAVVLEPIRLPAQVDQPQWFVRLPDDSVAVLEDDRWASPLRDELRQALLERLAVRWGAVTTGAAPGGSAPVRVAVEVRRFDGVVGRESRLEGSWTISAGQPSARLAQCEWSIREAADAGTAGLAAAHRKSVARLGDAIGEAAIKAARNERIACPARDAAAG